jgi:ABC-type cobalamin/Fe3+-siderophores transport system ATPase subunit
MIKSLKLRFGKAPALPPQTIDATSVTVFVGPNNSGKSKILQEIFRYVTSGQQNTNDVILDAISFEPFARTVAEDRIAAVTLRPNFGETVLPDHVLVGRKGVRNSVPRERLVQALTNPDAEPNVLCNWYLSFNTLILDGKSRIGLVQQQQAGDLQGPAQTSFQALFRDDVRRSELRRIIHEAFGIHLVIDPTYLGVLRLRLSTEAPASDFVERGIHHEAVQFHSKALLIDFGSDGLKAFTGMMTEIVAGDPEILLIDEPEAFLHPALSFLLGKELARASAKAHKRLFVSTHSPSFVMGCVQSGAPITLVRLTYKHGVPTARVLASADILRLMRNPLLRSTGVLTGLFYESVVVTESDADRAFYQEINERLLRHKPEWGVPNCLFINAQNKQTVPTILKPLRQLGIPAVGIVDVDVIKEGGAVWSSMVDGAFLPQLEQQSLATLRAAVKAKFDVTGRDMKRQGGVMLLDPPDREAAENLFARLSEYGVFVVPRGELESWLPLLGASGHGPQWLVAVFEKLGEDPDSADYVKPQVGDVWEFLGAVKEWLNDPMRKGIPA